MGHPYSEGRGFSLGLGHWCVIARDSIATVHSEPREELAFQYASPAINQSEIGGNPPFDLIFPWGLSPVRHAGAVASVAVAGLLRRSSRNGKQSTVYVHRTQSWRGNATLSIISIAYISSIVCSSWISHRVIGPVRTKGNSTIAVPEREPARVQIWIDRSLATSHQVELRQGGAKVTNQPAGGEVLQQPPGRGANLRTRRKKSKTQKKEAGNYVGPRSPISHDSPPMPLPF